MGTKRAMLEALADGPVSGPDLAAQIGVSRAAVWKAVESLRDAGFSIDGSSEGYVVRATPAYGGAAIRYGLDAPFRVEYHDQLGSTNERARELAIAGDSNVAIIADEQTTGRGRLGREWFAPPGGIWVSALQRPDIPPAHAPVFTLAAAVATTQVCREAGVNAHIKWPNDVLVGECDPEAGRPLESREMGADKPSRSARGTPRSGRKLAGILTEMEGEADRVSWLVVGIGVNANIDAAKLPADATSLRAEAADIDRRRFLQRLLERFTTLCEDTAAVIPAWREYASTLGTRVRIDTGVSTHPNSTQATDSHSEEPSPQSTDHTVEGRAVDIEFPGTLVVDTGSEFTRVHAGDCQHLRPDHRT